MGGWLEGTPLAPIPGAVAAGLIAGTLLPLLGLWVVLQRVVFLGVTLAQIAAAGVALGLVLELPPLPAGLAATLIVVALGARRGIAVVGDRSLGAAFCLASALALLFVARSATDLDQVHHVLYGNLIYASPDQVKLVGATLLAGAALVALFFKEILFAAFDGETAQAQGLSTRFWLLLLFGVLAVVLSVSMRTTGSLLTFAMLVLPPLAALQLQRGLLATFVLSSALGLLGTLAGLLLAVSADLHVESSITVTLFLGIPVAAAWRRHPLLGIGLIALLVLGGSRLAPPTAEPAAPAHHHHHHEPAAETEPWHVDVHLQASQPSGADVLTVEWSLDVFRGDVAHEIPEALWLVLTGDGLVHEHELVHDLPKLPTGESRHTGTFTVPADAPVFHVEGQLWTGPTPSLEALPVEPARAAVFGCDVSR